INHNLKKDNGQEPIFYFKQYQINTAKNKIQPPPRQNFRKPRKTSKNLWGLVFNIRYVLML
ncbi:MAG TPA: hypothetical protein DEB43_03620, partial [Desulfovibrio sp.]|nr:hypothetical protein [Desulfovibrio sp.]